VSSRIPSGSRSWRSPPSTFLRVAPMEVERFKHRQLTPTVGLSSRSSGEFKGPHEQKSIYRDGCNEQLAYSSNPSSRRNQVRIIYSATCNSAPSAALSPKSIHTRSRRPKLAQHMFPSAKANLLRQVKIRSGKTVRRVADLICKD
jgi:hypothetical protein